MALLVAFSGSDSLGGVEVLLLALVALALTALFATLRSALLHSVPSRVLEDAASDTEREALRPLLERAEPLATSASVFEITSLVLFVVLVLGWIGDQLSAGTMGMALGIGVPLLVFTTEVLPSMLRGEPSDRLLRALLPAFDLLQRPLAALTAGLEGLRHVLARMLRIAEPPRAARRIVEDLRDVIEDSDREDPLKEEERELIENVVEFYDVDVAEIMTPRTEIHAVEIDAGLDALVKTIQESGHARIPIFEKTLDRIVGLVYAQEVIGLLANGTSDGDIRPLVKPIELVPETKLVSELLSEFRTDKRKMAVVIDEYGGTAGIVTISDVVAELVGEMREELGETAPEPIRRRPDGKIEIDGTARVSEVNEELEIELPEEEDYETVAGFVLAQFGRFPRPEEAFVWRDLRFTVSRATDRRVLEVLLEMPVGHKLAP